MVIPFSSLALLYFMALKTPMIHSVLDSHNAFEIHEIGGLEYRRFAEAAIKTSITLLRHFRMAESQDAADLKNRSKQDLVAKYALPIHSDSKSVFDSWLRNDLLIHLRWLRNHDVTRFTDLVRDLLGLSGA
jgi:hypothetical protein